MNKIIVDNNKLVDYKDSNIEIVANKIKFISNGEYTLEVINSNLLALDIEVLDNIDIRLFIYSFNNCLVVNNHYIVGKNSNLIINKFYYNKDARENVVVDLNGEGSSINYNFSSISRGIEEYHIIVNHNHHRVSSMISNKCVGIDNSSIKLVIDSVLDKGNLGCVMDQNSRILSLGDMEACIIPNMFIDEDSVNARHGSVIGRISEEDIFYLLSRGISEAEAINLVVKGLIISNLDLDMELRARIFECIQGIKR